MTQAFASIKHAMLDYGSHSQLHMTTVSEPCIKIAWLSYLAIVSLAMVKWRSLPPSVYASMKSASVAMASVGMGVSLTVCGVMIAVVSRRRMRRSRGVVKGCIYMTIAFTYIVYPLTLRLMAEVISDKKVDAIFMVFAVIIMIMGVFPAFCGTRLLKSQFPINKLFLSCNSRVTESLIYWIESIMLVIPPVAEGRLSTFQSASLSLILSIIVGLTTILCTWRRRVYWNQYTNILFATAFFCSNFLIFLISMKSLGLIEKDGFWYTISFALVALYGKIMANRTHTLAFVDLLTSKTSDADFKQACYYFEQSWVKLRDGSKSKLDHKIYAFYYGSFLKGVYTTTANGEDDSDMDLAEREMHMLLKDFHFELMHYIHENRQSSKELMDLLLYLMLGQTMQSLSYSFISLKAYKRSIAGHFFGELDYAFLQLVFEVKLNAIYKGKIKDDDPSEDIADAYSYLKWHMTPDTAEDGNKLDIATPFKASYHFKKIGILIENILKYQSNIYERMDQDGNTSSQIYYNLNIKTKNTKDSCERAINKLIIEHNIDDLVTYFYPNLIFFYALIRYEIKIADKLLYHYKKKLFKLGHLKALDANGKIDPDLLIEINSVTMRVSISEESMGKIKDISLNYYEYLGHEISGKEAIDSNISAMILPEFQELHANAMASLNSTEQLDRHQHMLVRDFDGYTREFSGKIKLMPSLQIELSSVVNLQTKEKKSSMVVLLDKNNAIVGGDQAFTIVIAQAGVDIEKDKVNFSKISSNICASINLLRVLATNTSQKKEVKNQKAGCSKRIFRCVNSEEEDRLLESLKNLKLSNDSDGLQYMIEDKSILCDIMTHPTMTATVNLIQVFGKDMVKVIIGKAPFRSILYENPQTMTMNSMNETKEKTNRDQISSSASREDHNQAFRSHNNFDRVAKDALTFDDGGLSSKKFDEMAVGLLKALDFTYKKQKEAESKRSILDLDSIMPAVASESLELIRQVAKEVALISVDENRVNSTDQAVISDMQPCLLLNLKSLILKGEKLPIDKKKIKMQMSSIINDTSQSEMQWKMSLKAFKSYVKDPQQSPLSPPSFLMPMTEERIPDMNDSEFMLSKFKTLKTVKQKRSHRPTAIKVHMAEDKDNNAKLINGKAGSKRMIRFDIPEADINDEKSPEGKRSPRKRLPTRFDKSDKKLAEMDENQDFGKKIGLASVSMKQKTTNGIAENDEKAQKIDEMDKIEKIDEMDEKLKHKEPTYVSTDKDNGIKERTLIEIARSLKSRLRLKTKIAVGLSAVVSQKIKVMNIRKTKEQNSLMNSRRETESQMAKKKINLATIDFIGQMISKVMVVYDNQSNEITIIR